MIAVVARGQGQASAQRFGDRHAVALGVGVQLVVLARGNLKTDLDGLIVRVNARAADPFHAD